MKIENIDLRKTKKAVYKQINKLKNLGVTYEEIDSDINYIGLVCCNKYYYGNFYKYYYERLINYLNLKIKELEIIRNNERNNIRFIPEKKDSRLESPLHDDYLSSLASHYINGLITDNDFRNMCGENGIGYNEFIETIDNYYSLKVVF